jgi:hypothetical protein
MEEVEGPCDQDGMLRLLLLKGTSGVCSSGRGRSKVHDCISNDSEVKIKKTTTTTTTKNWIQLN